MTTSIPLHIKFCCFGVDFESEETRKRYASIVKSFGATGTIYTYNTPAKKINRKKPEKYKLSKTIRGFIRYCVQKIDPVVERAFFGFDPKNEMKFFKKPYHKSAAFALLIMIFLIIWAISWIVMYPLYWIWEKLSTLTKHFRFSNRGHNDKDEIPQ